VNGRAKITIILRGLEIREGLGLEKIRARNKALCPYLPFEFSGLRVYLWPCFELILESSGLKSSLVFAKELANLLLEELVFSSHEALAS
jgi:hypothetical protein